MSVQFACFKVGDVMYAADIMKIREIIRFQKITAVPKVPDFIEGVMNLRGQAVPVIDMRKRLGIAGAERGAKTRVVIVKVGGKDTGMIVDSVERVINTEKNEIKEAPHVVKGVDTDYLEGVLWDSDELVMILNIDKILTSKEKLSFDGLEVITDKEAPTA
ncbi:MAG: chemotaxis protein CheW [Deltaproteobacteria bacterium]|nr:chemotaxis protein CheW [Deltaproteobacteria bacterium]